MNRSFHARPALFAAALLAAAVSSATCSRTIEEDAPRALVEHRIEPCRERCAAQLDPECGAIIEEQAWRSVDDCAEDCAAVEPVYAWGWGRRADGTDACAEEWIAASDCVVALTCEERLRFFREHTPDPHDDYPCKLEIDAKQHCFYTEPSLERVDD